MTLNEILIILQNRLITLTDAKKTAEASGNLDQVVAISSDILSTELSIQQITSTLSTN